MEGSSSWTDQCCCWLLLFQGYPTDRKKAILQHFLSVYSDTAYSEAHKIQMLKHLINPLLKASFLKQEAEHIIDKPVRKNH